MAFWKWCICFFVGLFCGLAVIACFNLLTDPFGVFGDRLMQWHGYNFTNNPRIAKIEYVRTHADTYDSYIIGSSKTSSVSPAQLNAYFGDASFYNMMVYGADAANMERILYYLDEHCQVKNIVLHLGLSELTAYDVQTNDIKQITHARVTNRSLTAFYTRFLLNDPKYGIEKAQKFLARPYLPFYQVNDVFIPEQGNYNKSVRDAENIININEYKSVIGDGSFYETSSRMDMRTVMTQCLDAIRRMKAYCDARQIQLLIISAPNFEGELYGYDMALVREYWLGLAEIADFWLFSGYNTYADDPRYFYDKLHYRNGLGDMMLARIWDDPTAYVHEDFGRLVTKANAAEQIDAVLTPHLPQTATLNENPLVAVPILMYHHFVPDDEAENAATRKISRFVTDIEALLAAGYTPLFFSDLVAYVNGDASVALPEKPIVITIDDGYLSNFTLAFPVLQRLNVKATIFMIGWSIGRDTRLDGVTPILPHFDLAQAAQMKASGLVDLQSHTYDFHETAEEGFARTGLLPMESETAADYYEAFKQDTDTFNAILQDALGEPARMLSYPYGLANLLSDQIAKDLGFQATVLTGDKVGFIQKGDPQSLYGLYRINVANHMDVEDILAMIE